MPSTALAPWGSPSTPLGATARTPPAAQRRHDLGEGLGGAGFGVVEAHDRRRQREEHGRLGAPGVGVGRSPPAAAVGDQASTARPSSVEVRTARATASCVAAVAVDEHDAGEGVGRAHQLDEHGRQRVAARSTACPSKPACSPLAP